MSSSGGFRWDQVANQWPDVKNLPLFFDNSGACYDRCYRVIKLGATTTLIL
jgi:hypothetical protein